MIDFLKMEKHYFEVQKELDLVTKERDKGKKCGRSAVRSPIGFCVAFNISFPLIV